MKTYVVGNWKMNLTVGEASIYLHKLLREMPSYRDVVVAIAPPLLALQPLSLQIDRRKIHLVAQNAYHRDFGAYTGEVAFTQLRGLVDFVIIGHSERRHIFGETNKDLRQKVAAALRNGITPILCVGETADERNYGETEAVIKDQLLGGLSEVSREDLNKVIIAYEPVWAISTSGTNGSGTARSATPEEVSAVVKLLRKELAVGFGKEAEQDMPVLYGGSVNSSNAGGYLTIPGVNGVLMGGASLRAHEFLAIIDIAKKVRS